MTSALSGLLGSPGVLPYTAFDPSQQLQQTMQGIGYLQGARQAKAQPSSSSGSVDPTLLSSGLSTLLDLPGLFAALAAQHMAAATNQAAGLTQNGQASPAPRTQGAPPAGAVSTPGGGFATVPGSNGVLVQLPAQLQPIPGLPQGRTI